jgi:hypothetical protein
VLQALSSARAAAISPRCKNRHSCGTQAASLVLRQAGSSPQSGERGKNQHCPGKSPDLAYRMLFQEPGQGESLMWNGICRRNVVALRKGGETFIVLYDDADAEGAVRAIARFAANPELNFTWRDAAVLVCEMVLPVPAPIRPAPIAGELPHSGPPSPPE